MDFKLGDSVKVIRSDHREDYYMVGLITEIGEGFLPYRVHVPEQSHAGYWHKEDDLELATEQPATAPAGGGDRDTVLRNELFGRVQSVLDGCNPAVANEFRNYGSLAEKQIQERDAEIAYKHGLLLTFEARQAELAKLYTEARAQLAAAEATATGLRRERDAALDVLRDIARNAPQEQPHANEQWKWTFWFAGSVAKSCVDTLSEQQAADAKPAGGA